MEKGTLRILLFSPFFCITQTKILFLLIINLLPPSFSSNFFLFGFLFIIWATTFDILLGELYYLVLAGSILEEMDVF